MAINYLPEESRDAEEVKKLVEAAGRKALLIPGDISDENFCKELVRTAVEGLGGLTFWHWWPASSNLTKIF